MKYQIFISYRREGGEATAQLLRDRLVERGFSVFYDIESLKSGKFDDTLYERIAECDDFVPVLSPQSLDRCKYEEDWVRKEIRHAIKLKKNIVPIITRGFAFPMQLPEDIDAIRTANGVMFDSMEFLEARIDKVLSMLQSTTTMAQRQKVGDAGEDDALGPLVRRLFIYLEDQEWQNALDYTERILVQKPECSQAYLGKVMAELKLSKEEMLGSASVPPLSQNKYFQRACKHASEEELKILKNYEYQNQYAHGVYAMNQAKSEKEFKDASQWFAANPTYKDSRKLWEECIRKAEQSRNEVLYQAALKLPREKQAEAFAALSGYRDADDRHRQIISYYQTLKTKTTTALREIVSSQRDIEERIGKTQDALQEEYKKLENLRDDARKREEQKTSNSKNGQKSLYSMLTETVRTAQDMRYNVTAKLVNSHKGLIQTISLAQEIIKALSDKGIAYARIQSICDSDLANARTQLQGVLDLVDEASREARQLQEMVSRAEIAYHGDLNGAALAGLRAVVDIKRSVYDNVAAADRKMQSAQRKLTELIDSSREQEEKELHANRRSVATEMEMTEQTVRSDIQKLEQEKAEAKRTADDATARAQARIAILSGTNVPFPETKKAYDTLPEFQAAMDQAYDSSRNAEKIADRIVTEVQKLEDILSDVRVYRRQQLELQKERKAKLLKIALILIPILTLALILFVWLSRDPAPSGSPNKPGTTTTSSHENDVTGPGNGGTAVPGGPASDEENTSEIPEEEVTPGEGDPDPFDTDPADTPDIPYETKPAAKPDESSGDDSGDDPWEEPETEPEAVTAPPRELLEPGLYDENNFEIASWDELVNVYGLDVTKNYSYTSYQEDRSCLYYILTNNPELAKGTTLVIGKVSSIGALAFDRCNQLTTVILRDGVTNIGKNAFHMCKSMTNFEFTKTVEKIERGAFLECTSLKDVYYIGTLENWCHITIEENGNPCSNGADLYIDRKLVEYVTIPESVQAIPGYAFFGCTSIQNVTLSRNLQTVGTAAFESCVNLEEVSVSRDSRLSTISAHAFMGCTRLVSIEIPTSVKTIGNLSFKNCSSLSEIRFHGSSAQWKAISFGYDWSMYTGDFVIECTDATIAK